MTHSESLAHWVVDAAAMAMADCAEDDQELRGWTGAGLRGDARAAAVGILDVLRREHTAGLMPYNPGAYLTELIEKVREVS